MSLSSGYIAWLPLVATHPRRRYDWKTRYVDVGTAERAGAGRLQGTERYGRSRPRLQQQRLDQGSYEREIDSRGAWRLVLVVLDGAGSVLRIVLVILVVSRACFGLGRIELDRRQRRSFIVVTQVIS